MLTRRQFLLHSTAATLGAHAYGISLSGLPVPVERKVAQGRLRGEVVNGLQIFRGVPFAQPPLGNLRFKAPLPPVSWTGVHDTTRFAAAAVQPGESGFEQSEDCLYLNVWAPHVGGPYPVFVWIHGGGFTGGRSFEPLFDGSHFAQAGIVCVTVAYRLGALGFLDVAPLLGEGYAGSANNALRDLIAALTWLRENVSVFGGDPHRVTIGGESAGAKLTDMLMGVPSAEPLFHQMISESGGAERISPTDRAAQVSRSFGSAWTRQTSLAITELLSAPARKIIEVQDQFTREWPVHFPLRAELDEKLIPQTPLSAIRRGSTRGKRLLLGTNRDESALFIGLHPQRDATAADLGNLMLAQFSPIAESYRRLYPAMSDELRRIRSVTAEEYWVPSMRVAEAHLEGGGEAFVYRLDFPGEGRFLGLAFHSYDLRFVWDFFGKELPSPAARQLASVMHEAWVAFIKGDAPKASGLPAWHAYSLDSRSTMVFDQISHVEVNPEAAELKLWDGLLVN